MSDRLRRMNPALQDALLTAYGSWDAAFQDKVPGMQRPNAKGEAGSVCPFQDHQETKPSWSVNVNSGLFHCKRCVDRKGDFVQLLCWLGGQMDDDMKLVPLDYSDVQRDLMEFYGLVRELDKAWLKATQSRLKSNPQDLERAFKLGWDHEIACTLGLGYDQARDRIVLPMYDHKDRLVNAKLYGGDHGSKAKMTWELPIDDANLLFPRQARTEVGSQFILVEGEPDVITLRSLSFAGVSGTQGSSHPVPPGEWWANRRVAILMDVDAAGQAGAALAARIMVDLAAEVLICSLEDWPGRPTNADISDYVAYLYKLGATREVVQQKVREVLEKGIQHHRSSSPLDAEPEGVPFTRLLSAEMIGRPVLAPAKIVGVGLDRFALPTQVRLHCDHGSMTICRSCPMHRDRMGDVTIDLDYREQRTLSLIQARDSEQLAVLKMHDNVRAPADCPKLQMEVLQSIGAVPAVLTPPTPEVDATGGEEEEEGADSLTSKRKEVFLLLPDDTSIAANRDYEFTGINYPDPRSQKMVFIGHDLHELEEGWGSMVLGDDALDHLEQFKIGGTGADDVIRRLEDVADDLSTSVTGIIGRQDLHLLMRCVWHSLLAFPYKGELMRRGWLEALVLGDTCCGKSASFQQYAKWLKVGALVDCQNQSIPGLTGTVVQSTLTGEWIAVPGLLPQLDGKVVCFDEFHAKTEGGQSLVQALASQRSEGYVRIAKAAHATFQARVRALYFANPGRGKLLRDLGQHAVALVPLVIPQPEHVRRFDLAMSVAVGDVDTDAINNRKPMQAPRYSREAQQTLLRWAYSRKSDQVEWEAGAEAAVAWVAGRMVEYYHDGVPLVERGSQWLRVAKLAVSIAAQCFSTTDDPEVLLVRAIHVQAAGKLFHRWFDSPSFGYGKWSAQQRAEGDLRDRAAVEEVFRQVSDGPGLATVLLAEWDFSERQFRHAVAGERAYAEEWLNRLLLNRALKQGRRGDRYEKTAAFTRWLEVYLADTQK